MKPETIEIKNPSVLDGLMTKKFDVKLINIINWVAGIAGLISALIIVIAGIMWATASGDEDRQGTARKMLISGVVGLVIALAALAIVTVVTGRL